jgi:hypothetical protein
MTLFQQVKLELKRIGISLDQAPAEYLINYLNPALKLIMPKRALDLEDALLCGKEMAANPPKPRRKPMPPMGNTPGAKIRAYRTRKNRAWWANEQAKEAAAIEKQIADKLKRK